LFDQELVESLPPVARRYLQARVPRLVPRDSKAPDAFFCFPQLARGTSPTRLEFTGRIGEQDGTEFLLLYPTEKKADKKEKPTLASSLRERTWTEEWVSLDF